MHVRKAVEKRLEELQMIEDQTRSNIKHLTRGIQTEQARLNDLLEEKAELELYLANE